LKRRVFDEIFPILAEGFVAGIREREGRTAELVQERLDGIFRGVLTLLYRLLSCFTPKRATCCRCGRRANILTRVSPASRPKWPTPPACCSTRPRIGSSAITAPPGTRFTTA